MDPSANRGAEQQWRALDFMLDALGLRSAWEEVSRELESEALARAVAALEAESDRALRAAMRERAGRDPDREPNDI